MGACSTNIQPEQVEQEGKEESPETPVPDPAPKETEYRTLRSIPSISALQAHVDEIRKKNRDHTYDLSHSWTAMVKGFSFDSRLSALSDLPLSYSGEFDTHHDVYDRKELVASCKPLYRMLVQGFARKYMGSVILPKSTMDLLFSWYYTDGRSVDVVFRSIRFVVTNITRSTTILEMKQKIKWKAQRLIDNFDRFHYFDANLIADDHLLLGIGGVGNITDDTVCIAPYFEHFKCDTLQMTVEEAIEVILEIKDYGIGQWRLILFPSDSMESVYYRTYQMIHAAHIESERGQMSSAELCHRIHSLKPTVTAAGSRWDGCDCIWFNIYANEERKHPVSRHVYVWNVNLKDGDQLRAVSKHRKRGHRMRIFIRYRSNHAYHVQSEQTVSEIKWMIRCREGIPFANQRLMFRGDLMMDDRTLSSYHVQHQSSLSMLILRES